MRPACAIAPAPLNTFTFLVCLGRKQLRSALSQYAISPCSLWRSSKFQSSSQAAPSSLSPHIPELLARKWFTYSADTPHPRHTAHG